MRGEKQTGKAATRKSVVANSLQAMNPDLARVAPESLQSLLQASHPDPFALLGAHGGPVLVVTSEPAGCVVWVVA